MNDLKFVVIDDDPTGTQTVSGNLLLTAWSEDLVEMGFDDPLPFFYILANTRAENAREATRRVREIVSVVLGVAKRRGTRPVLISRSDSTLRSHFPLEVEILREELTREMGRAVDATLFCPAFFEGGRITVGDVHYIELNGKRIEVGATEYARDSVFPFSTSRLPDYIEEKTQGRTRARDVVSINASVPDISLLRNGAYAVVNTDGYASLDRLTLALRSAMEQGRCFCFQSGASLVSSLTGQRSRILSREDIGSHLGNGLVLVGSHTGLATAQLRQLLEEPDVVGLELDARLVIEETEFDVGVFVGAVHAILAAGRTPVVFTSRMELRFASDELRQQAGQRIAGALAEIARRVSPGLDFVIAKGGITSHRVLQDGLEVRWTRVIGQLVPGVSVVRLPPTHAFGAIPFVIFPGNVGDEGSLREVYQILKGQDHEHNRT